MKRKIIALLLVASVTCGLCACGSSTDGNSKDEADNQAEQNIESDVSTEEQEMYIDYDEDGYPVIHISHKQLADRIQLVTLTEDNWKEYFEDYNYIEHVVDKNAFGDVESEYDIRHYGFGLKKGVFSNKNIALKFDGKTTYDRFNFSCADCAMEGKEGYLESYHKAGSTQVVQKCNNGHEKTIEVESKDYFVTGPDFYLDNGYHFMDYNCLGAIGEIAIVDLPLTDDEFNDSVTIIYTDHIGEISRTGSLRYYDELVKMKNYDK